MNAEQQSALAAFRADMKEETLWSCILAFQQFPFRTASGLPFTYTVKIGKHGGYNKELLIDRRENSKTLTASSVFFAFRKAMEACTDEAPARFDRPKAIGDIRSISYIYPLLYRFGVIDVPETVKQAMLDDELMPNAKC